MGKNKAKKPGVVSPTKGKQTPQKKVTIDSDEDSSSSSSSEVEVGTFIQQTPVKKNVVVTKQPAQKQTPTLVGSKAKTLESSSDEGSSDSDDEEEVPKQTKQISPQKKQSAQQLGVKGQQPGVTGQQLGVKGQQLGVKGQQLGVKGQQLAVKSRQFGITVGRQKSSDKDSSLEEDDSDEEVVPIPTKQTSPQKKPAVHQAGTKAVVKKAQDKESLSEEEDSDDDDSDEEEIPEKQIPQQKTKQVSPASAKAVGQKVQVKESSSEEDDDSDEDDSDEEEEAPKSLKQLPQQKKQVPQLGIKAGGQKVQVKESSSEEEDDSDEDDSDDEKEAPKSVKPTAQQKKQAVQKQIQVEDSDEDSSEDDEEDSSEEEDDDDKEDNNSPVKSAQGVQDEDSEDEEESDDEEESEEEKEIKIHKRKGETIKEQPAAKKRKRKGDDDSSEEETEAVKVPESKKRKKEKVKKEPTSKKPKHEAVNGSQGTISLYVGHLDKNTTEDEIKKFFSKNHISLSAVRKPLNKSNAFVDLEDADDLQDALALNGSMFKNNAIAVEKAKPRLPAQAKPEKKTTSSSWPGNTGNKSGNEKDNRTLFVKNLPENATAEGLRSVFDSAVDIKIPKKDGAHKGFGFVEFADAKSMELAKSKYQGVDFNGSSLFLDYVGSRSSFKKQHTSPGGKQGRGGGRQGSSGTRGQSKALFVKNLSYNTNESTLKAAFKGAVSVRIPTFQDSGKSKGFAFVDFSTAEAAAKAFDSMKGQAIDGRQLTLDFAIDKSAGSGGGRGGFSPRGRGGKGGGKGFRGDAGDGGQKGTGGFSKAKGGVAQARGKKITFSEDSE